ncbi:Ca-activated chloride channel family protein [Loktanella sp. PT4BL]|jgi:Ca-activated chloride channel family protein|uniref:vWA domain-containing protein n=1 Tax=Loktanella sp. PT4BL TaxID=2135611 RepID=UPI000D76E9E1|nr:VWA domain-containing protein [Loktanella sp. PT4BL]PXW68866.1 Ca-activated chloride channel family protein [Loktanella sp. PT4BL]
MTDDLNDLKAMMDAATPRPDLARRAENIALAQKNFADLQGSAQAARPTAVTGPKGLWTGVKTMLSTITTKGGLTATTALVACGFLIMTPQGQDLLRPPSSPQITVTEFNRAIVPPEAVSGSATVAAPREDTFASQPQDIATAPAVDLTPNLNTADRSRVTAKSLPQVTADADILQQQAAEIAEGMTQGQAMAATTMQTSRVAPTLNDEQAMPRLAPERVVVAPPPQADDAMVSPAPSTESFANIAASPLKITAEEPVSTFSIDVDTASYALVRSSLSRGELPPREAVRIEEMINYFPYDYPTPDAGEAPFRPTVTTFQTPWNANTQLVHIALQGRSPEMTARPPLNLVFLIDTSGSMDDPAKLPLLKQSFRLMLDQLRPQDQVAIVEYAGSAGQVLAPTNASERTTILQALQSLGAGGATNGQGGLEQAYAVADTMAEAGEVSRIILATDGDFNVGIDNPDALKDFIADRRETGTYLSVLGFGRGNLDDATMQALAQNGNGTAAYIDTLSEAQKVLVDQLSGALFPIAGDVKVQVEFNPAQIAEYRLIGYETRGLRREEFNNDAVDAGELGAGHAVTAIYEVTPVGSPAQLSDPLRYAPSTVAETSDELGFLKLRYKAPGEDVSQLLKTPITGNGAPGTEANFAAAIAGFGQLLRGDDHLGDWGYADAITLAAANRGEDTFGYRTEAVQLMRLAESLSRAE